jgi:hypothetical protein
MLYFNSFHIVIFVRDSTVTEDALMRYIFPPSPDAKGRCIRFIAILSTLKEPAYNAFIATLTRGYVCRKFMKELLTTTGEISPILISRLCHGLPTPQKMEAAIKKWPQQQKNVFDSVFKNMLKTLMAPTSSYSETLKAARDLKKRMEKHYSGDELFAMNALINRLSSAVFHHDCVTHLMQILAPETPVTDDEEEKFAMSACKILRVIYR